jgi:hypothetical protein
MARIVHALRRTDLWINGPVLFGRAVSCDGRLTSAGASKEHASIDWDGSGWILRDLGSRNGTRINNVPLSGREWRLDVRDRIAFGDPEEVWEWLDGAGPVPCAVEPDGTRLWGSVGFLALPDEAHPVASAYMRSSGWELDDGATVRFVESGTRVEIDGRVFLLELPSVAFMLGKTRTFRVTQLVSRAGAKFEVSSDEDHVAVQFSLGTTERKLPPRAFAYMLLTLARARAKDQQAGVSAAESGWLYTDELADMLRTTPEKLNVDVHRARSAIAQLGIFDDPDNVVERRQGQLRIGFDDLTIERVSAR